MLNCLPWKQMEIFLLFLILFFKLYIIVNHRRNQKRKKKKEIKICIETNENENTTTQNLWDMVKSSPKGKVHSNTGTPQETRKKSNK